MSGNTVRQKAIATITAFKSASPSLNYKETSSSELFGVNVFGLSAMKTHLPKDVYKSLKKTIDGAQPLDPSTAEQKAALLALELGVQGREARQQGLDERRLALSQRVALAAPIEAADRGWVVQR